MDYINPNSIERKQIESASSSLPTRLEVLRSSVWRAPSGGVQGETSGGLLDYWERIKRHKLIFLCGTAAGLALGILWPRIQTPVYRARASVEVFQKTGAEAPIDAVPTESFVRTQIKILESESLAHRAAARLSTDEKPTSDQPGWLAQLDERIRGSQPAPQTTEELASVLASGMKVRTPDGTRLVELAFDCGNPGFCKHALEALVAEFIATTAGTRENLAKETSSWLVDQLATMRRNLEASESRLLNFAASSGLVLLGEKDNVAEETLRQLHAELARAEVERMNKQSRQELASAEPVSSLPEILDSGPLRQYEVQLTDLKRQFAEVSKTYLPEHYKYERLQAQIQEVEQAIDRERVNIVKRIDNEHRAADRRRQLLEDRYAKQLASVGRQSRDLVQYNLLKRDVDLNRQVYEATLQRMRAYGIQSALHANHVRVIDQPKTPMSPHWPKLKWTVALGLFAGILCGFTCVLLKGAPVATVQAPGQVGVLVGAPELGFIPDTAESGGVGLLRRPVLAPARWSDPSFPADSFRSTLASLLLARGDDRPRSLIVTSALPREGKTTSTAHLAIALAEAGQNVLVLDADTRKPRLHELFGISNARGLVDLLASPSGTDPSPFLSRAGHLSLDILPAGQPTRAGSLQVLYSARWPELLIQLCDSYDTVLIDSPPILNVPHARILGKLVDGVVLVVRANETHRDAVAFARQRLRDDGISVLGAILNNWRPDASAYGYRGSYGYYGVSKAMDT